MRVFPVTAALLLFSAPAFALKTAHTTHIGAHARSTHASLKTSTHGTAAHRTQHAALAAPLHHEAPAHHEAPVSMPADRATAIQSALIQNGYLSGEPSGTWDPQTVAAMARLQSDNGWQTHVTPDARALIKLGLGPSTEAPPQ